MTNMDRRTFLAAAGIIALAHGRSVSTSSNSSFDPLQLTGNGEWTHALYPAGESCPRAHRSEERMVP